MNPKSAISRAVAITIGLAFGLHELLALQRAHFSRRHTSE
jgi:hypothetical protein